MMVLNIESSVSLQVNEKPVQERLFKEFLSSEDNLRVYAGDKLLFASREDRLSPMVQYIEKFGIASQQTTIMDRLVGNAAALLAIKANCREVYTPVVSQLAIETLQNHRVDCHFTIIIPYVKKNGSDDMCPMEKLSLGKGPEEFYQALKSVMANRKTGQ